MSSPTDILSYHLVDLKCITLRFQDLVSSSGCKVGRQLLGETHRHPGFCFLGLVSKYGFNVWC